MIFGLFKFLFKAVGFELLLREPVRLFQQEINSIKEEIRKKMAKLVLKVMLWLSLATLLMVSCVFALLALAFYLNEILYSNYKGFLLVAGGCMVVDLLVLLIVSLRGWGNKD
jgi:hypothetical protein